MAKTLTATDRSALIRLASSMEKGSPERKTILSGLKSQGTHRTALYWGPVDEESDLGELDDWDNWTEFLDDLDKDLRGLGFRKKKSSLASAREDKVIREFEYTGPLGELDFTIQLEVDNDRGWTHQPHVRYQVEHVSWLEDFSNREEDAEGADGLDQGWIRQMFEDYIKSLIERA